MTMRRALRYLVGGGTKRDSLRDARKFSLFFMARSGILGSFCVVRVRYVKTSWVLCCTASLSLLSFVCCIRWTFFLCGAGHVVCCVVLLYCVCSRVHV